MGITTIGGPKFRWRGKNIRTIKGEDCNCVSLPRKDSKILTPISVDPFSTYRFVVSARKNSGNGLVAIKFSGCEYGGEEFVSFVRANQLNDLVFDVNIESIFDDPNLHIYRPPNASGNILVEQIDYEKIDTPLTKEELAAIEMSKKTLRGQEEIRERKEKETQKRELAGCEMGKSVTVGGNGYRWKGISIRTAYKFGTTCITLPKKDSTILIPASTINPSTRYQVKILAAQNTLQGKGQILVNFFGGIKYDSSHTGVVVSGVKLKEYSVIITSPKFPKNMPMNLRVWNAATNSGVVCIKSISYTDISKPKPKKSHTVAVKRHKKPATSVKKKFKPKRIIKHRKEDFTMKFKPYGKPTRDRVSEVFVSSADDVPKVSIITPTREGEDLIRKCWTALNANTSYPNWEWIVGDSDSQDGTVEFLRSLNDPRVKIIERNTTDGSFSSINNELAECATGDYYLFLNNDTEPQPFWLYTMMSKIYHHEEIGVVGARLKYPGGSTQHCGVAFIPEGPANIGREALKRLPPEYVEADRFYQAVTAACLLIRKKDFEAVGKFDPVYHFCYEDIDLCLKVGHNLNKKILYAAKAIAIHDESATQKKLKQHGPLQKAGIVEFKKRWMAKVTKDYGSVIKGTYKNECRVDVSFVTCVSDMPQYLSMVAGSLFKGTKNKNYEIIPILNRGNKYSAAQALNLGIDIARSNIIVCCHQDILFYDGWADQLFERVAEIEKKAKNWGVLGVAGIDQKDNTIGIVHNMRGKIQWQSTKKAKVFPVQTLDECAFVIRKNSRLGFDGKTFTGFHMYGVDICMLALSKGMKNYGIVAPLVHGSNSGSLVSGRKAFMKDLNAVAAKWRKKFPIIRTPTSIIRRKNVKTFIKFSS